MCAELIAHYHKAKKEKVVFFMCEDETEKLNCPHFKDKSLCVELPCEMDATIYFIDSRYEKQGRKKVKVEFINSGTIDNVTIGELGIPQVEICTKDNVWITFDGKEDFGVNCFTDPADAERKLKEVGEMKAVLISIKPKYCELIANGKKTIEVRKTQPMLELPFKCYIYCTKDNPKFEQSAFCKDVSNGKVIGEFVCDRIDDFYCASIPYRKENNLGYEYFIDNGVYKVDGWHEGVVFERSGPRIDTMLKNTDLENMCLSAQELFDYIGIGRYLYGWHITNLVIYDKPKEVRDFYHINLDYTNITRIRKAPQSWMYCLESEETE